MLRELRVRENSTHPQPWSSNLIVVAYRLNEMINPVLELQDQLARLSRIQQWAVDAWADNSRMGPTEVNSTEDDLPPDEEKSRFPEMSIGINHPRPAYSRRLDNLADLRDPFSTNLSGPSLHRPNTESFFVHFDEEESPEVIRCSTDLVVLQVSAGGHRVAYLTDFTLPSNLNFIIATGNEETVSSETSEASPESSSLRPFLHTIKEDLKGIPKAHRRRAIGQEKREVTTSP